MTNEEWTRQRKDNHVRRSAAGLKVVIYQQRTYRKRSSAVDGET